MIPIHLFTKQFEDSIFKIKQLPLKQQRSHKSVRSVAQKEPLNRRSVNIQIEIIVLNFPVS